jgi:hypothetical protein
MKIVLPYVREQNEIPTTNHLLSKEIPSGYIRIDHFWQLRKRIKEVVVVQAESILADQGILHGS